MEAIDDYLRESLVRLRDSKNLKKGVVAAALIDSGKVVYVTSELLENGRWLHAERKAVNEYISEYGALSDDAILAVSLSPCIKDSISREGTSCGDLLLGKDRSLGNAPVARVHVGVIDPFQADESFYRALEFGFTLTSDPP